MRNPEGVNQQFRFFHMMYNIDMKGLPKKNLQVALKLAVIL